MGKRAEYGAGHPAFLKYVQSTVAHPNYAGMPDVYKEDGSVQWEAPSNRKGGPFKDSHQRRREWWQRKAREIGIDPTSNQWISRVGKQIHPTNEKPCKKCGRIMSLRYAYPKWTLLRRIKKLPYYDEAFALDANERIDELLARLVEHFGNKVFADFPKLLSTPKIILPHLPDELALWQEWVMTSYVMIEPATLSPGAMSNSPDRFDGFHSFNRCCRPEADTGRHKKNMQSYATDRRVFEYWVDGDWVAANRLMGLVRSDPAMQQEGCLNGHPGPCQADHTGPISLGFAHRPEFQFLCRSCNSAKNNRMTRADVMRLITSEKAGEKVASWYCQSLWDLRKKDVADNETALRLSKLLRDNRHTYMSVLQRLLQARNYVFLTSLLGLERANEVVTFRELRAVGHVTSYKSIDRKKKVTKYAAEQKARRIEVAFKVLLNYSEKENRNAFVITTPISEKAISNALNLLTSVPPTAAALDKEMVAELAKTSPVEERLRDLAERVEAEVAANKVVFDLVKAELARAMDSVANSMSELWGTDRYVRAAEENEEEQVYEGANIVTPST